MADLEKDKAGAHRALKMLGSRRNDAYETGLAVLDEDVREWLGEEVANEDDEVEAEDQPYKADAASLSTFIEEEVLPWLSRRRDELRNRPLIRKQAFGEALNPHRLEQLGRYEVFLDRKLERMLTMLVRLKDLRQTKEQG